MDFYLYLLINVTKGNFLFIYLEVKSQPFCCKDDFDLVSLPT